MLVNEGQMPTFIQMEDSNKIKSVSILGCGWLGTELAKKMVANGVRVKGSTTSFDKASQLQEIGITPFVIDLNKPIDNEAFLSFLDSEIVYINVPPSKASSTRNSYAGAFDLLISLLPQSSIKKVIFISATSVYREQNGVVDENNDLSDSERAIRLIEAEQRFLKLKDIAVAVLRFGGLCGSGRNPITVLAGKNGITGGNQKVNMIHLEDCIHISLKLMHGNHTGVYNAVSDKHPVKALFYSKMAILYNLKAPNYIDSDKPAMGKETSCVKLKSALSYKFQFPDPLDFPN